MSFEELDENLFRIEVPLPDNPLRSLNAYLLRATSAHPGWRGRSLLIDNGFNRPECSQALLLALNEVGVPLENLDFFVTHLHSDHCGLTHELLEMAGRDSWAFASAGDSIHINMYSRQSFRWERLFAGDPASGLPADVLRYMMVDHPGVHYAISGPCPFTPVMDGDVLDYAGYSLRVLSMPGHTPDLLCLYDENKRILFSSDHVLGDITPNITRWREVKDSLGNYLHSLEKTKALDVDLCLPGHRRIVQDCRERVAALERHHAVRLDEVCNILDWQGESSAYDVASHMTWSIRAKNWEDFPKAQQYFACGEARAHLEHLKVLGRVKHKKHNGVVQYRLA